MDHQVEKVKQNWPELTSCSYRSCSDHVLSLYTIALELWFGAAESFMSPGRMGVHFLVFYYWSNSMSWLQVNTLLLLSHLKGFCSAFDTYLLFVVFQRLVTEGRQKAHGVTKGISSTFTLNIL